MKRPPYLMRVRINSHDRNITLWLPLFILLPLIIILLIIMLPFILLATAVLWCFGWGKPLLKIVPAALGCLCALRGLEVDLKHNNNEKVFISVK